jgi:hypothetical protein
MAEAAPTVIIKPEDIADEDRIEGKTHNLADELIVPRVDDWMHAELTVQHHPSWLCILTEGGRYKYWSPHNSPDPDPVKRELIRQVLYHMNKFAHYNGAWVGGYYGFGWPHMWLIWKDSDGDIQTTITTEGQGWHQYSARTMEAWRMNADAAIEGWAALHNLRVKDIGMDTVQIAKGEKPKDIHRWSQLDKELNL